MPPYHQFPFRDVNRLTRIVRNRGIEGSVPNRYTCGCGYDPAKVLSIPHLDAGIRENGSARSTDTAISICRCMC
jgi:hypothetical protein